jgi:hypothetical protein
MQIVQFIIDLHLVYFGSEQNILNARIHLIYSFSSLFLLCLHLLASTPYSRQLPWNRVGRGLWLRLTFELSSSFHQVLC